MGKRKNSNMVNLENRVKLPEKPARLFIEQRERFAGKDYLFCIIGYHLAPVLEKRKPAVILSFHNTRRKLLDLWKKHKTAFPTSGRLKYCEMKTGLHSILVFFYNPQMLRRIVDRGETVQLLQKLGYPGDLTLDGSLAHLKVRFNAGGCPHEVGVFLGIPVEDVVAFIANKGKNFKSSGYWKVYGDLFQAQRTFHRFEEAKHRYLGFLQYGISPCEYLQYYSGQECSLLEKQ